MRKYILIGLGTIILFLCMLGASYALWTLNLVQKEENYLATTCFDVTFLEDSTSTILLQNTYPLLDSEGSALTPYVFTVKNNCDAYAKYELSLEVNRNSTLNSEYLKVKVGDQAPLLLSSYPLGESTDSLYSSSYVLETGYLNAQESKEYQFRVWLDENVTLETEGVQNSRWSGRIQVTASYAENFGTNAVEYITNLASVDTNLAYDNTSDNNLRYIGGNPNNYVSFGETYSSDSYDVFDTSNNGFVGFNFSSLEECNTLKLAYGFSEDSICQKRYSVGGPILWRVIGVMNNIDDGSGNKASRIKLVRNDSIGNFSWDSSSYDINSGFGINEWSQSDLMKLMNPGFEETSVGGSLLWNGQNGTCYWAEDNDVVDCNFSGIGFSNDVKQILDSVLWNTGSNEPETDGSEILSHKFYALERSNNLGKMCNISESEEFCNDTVPRTSSWIGKVGLIYPSDYGYATSGGDSTDRSTCLNTELSRWTETPDCYKNNWLYGRNAYFQWTMMPMNDYNVSSFNTFAISYQGSVNLANDCNAFNVFPTVYLKSDVKIIRGDGSINHPYEFGL